MNTRAEPNASPAAADAPPDSWTAATFAAFREPGYGALWTNCLFTTLGVVMCFTCMFIVIADLTGSNGAVGAVTFCLGIPMLLLGPVAGVLADRLSKRLILGVCQASMSVATLSLGLLIITDLVSVPWVLGLAVVTGVCLSMLGPTQMAYMGGIVRPEGLGNATALFQACLNLTRSIGPFVVAGLVAFEAVGPGGSLLLVSALFAAALVPLASMPATPSGAASVDSVLAQLGLGIRHVLERPRLRQLVITYVFVTLVGFSYFVVLPRFTDNVLGAGASGYGIMIGISSTGGLLITLLVAPLADSPRVATLLKASAFLFGLGLIATGVAPTFLLALVAMVGVGAASSAFQALNSAAAYRETDPAYLGRIAALMNFAWSVTNLVGLPVGIMADAAGERATLIGVGCALCLLAAVLALWGTAPAASFEPQGVEAGS